MPKLFRNIFLLGLIVFVAARVYYRATDDFRLGNITYDMPHRAEWDIPPLNPSQKANLQEVFNQKFTYIGKGAQSYAFGSDDGKYVIKFFKFKHLRPSWFVDNLPDIGPLKAYREREQYKKNRKLLSVFNGYRLAYEVHREEAGLTYVHLNKSNHLNLSVTVVDKIGIHRDINLDDVNFILQERVVTSRKVINTALAQGNVQLANERIRSLIDLYLSEYAKGIFDHDHGILHNTGFVGERPVHLDVGKLYRDENIHKPEYAQKDLSLIVAKISTRTYEKFPNLHHQVADAMKQYLVDTLDEPAEYLLECCYSH